MCRIDTSAPGERLKTNTGYQTMLIFANKRKPRHIYFLFIIAPHFNTGVFSFIRSFHSDSQFYLIPYSPLHIIFLITGITTVFCGHIRIINIQLIRNTIVVCIKLQTYTSSVTILRSRIRSPSRIPYS